MDLAKVVSANLGVDIVWTPYKFSSWALNLFTSLVEFGLGFIPVVGPLLAVDFSITLTAITDPDFFESDNVLGLSLDVLGAVIDSASQSKKFMSNGFHFATRRVLNRGALRMAARIRTVLLPKALQMAFRR